MKGDFTELKKRQKCKEKWLKKKKNKNNKTSINTALNHINPGYPLQDMYTVQYSTVQYITSKEKAKAIPKANVESD